MSLVVSNSQSVALEQGSDKKKRVLVLADNDTPQQASNNKKIKAGKICAICKVSKSKDCFSKNQAKKGNGRCRECIETSLLQEKKPSKKALTPEEREARQRRNKEEKEKRAQEKLEREKAKAKAFQEEIERLKSLGLDETVAKFFTKFIEIKKDEDYLLRNEELKEMIQQEPKLLELSCPKEIDEECLTVIEYLCTDSCAGGRDLLVALVKNGAPATDKCYELVNQSIEYRPEYYLILMLSGYLPESFDLDGMVEDDDVVDECEKDFTDIISVLTRNAKRGDGLSCFGKVTRKISENLKKLPELKAGVTHRKGGPFEKLMNKFLEEVKEVKREQEKEMERFKSLGLGEKAIKFFSKFIELTQGRVGYLLNDELEEMIQQEPKLLELSCPKEIDKECLTVTEYMCQQSCPWTRDMLFDLVENGALATDKCYELVDQYMGVISRPEYYLVLMLSGYLPESFDLDGMVEDGDVVVECEDHLTNIISALTRNAKPGDTFSCGKVTRKICENLKKLPELKAGVTHRKGGPFEKLMNKILEQEEMDALKEKCDRFEVLEEQRDRYKEGFMKVTNHNILTLWKNERAEVVEPKEELRKKSNQQFNFDTALDEWKEPDAEQMKRIEEQKKLIGQQKKLIEELMVEKHEISVAHSDLQTRCTEMESKNAKLNDLLHQSQQDLKSAREEKDEAQEALQNLRVQLHKEKEQSHKEKHIEKQRMHFKKEWNTSKLQVGALKQKVRDQEEEVRIKKEYIANIEANQREQYSNTSKASSAGVKKEAAVEEKKTTSFSLLQNPVPTTV